MKKRLALILTLGMVISMSTTVFAATTTTDLNDTTKTGTTTLTYEQASGYTVTIPADFNVTKDEVSQTISAKDVVIPSGKSMKVKVSSPNYATGWYLIDKENTENKLAYTMKKGADAVVSGDEILSVSAGTISGSQALLFQVTDNVTKAGTYTDTLTFIVSVE